MKRSAVYKITNTVSKDFYIGSSKDVEQRWKSHKKPSTWNRCSNNPMYLDMLKYGVDKFEFQILEEVEIEQLKEKEQHFIEKLKPTYNNYRAKGRDIERYKKLSQSDKYKKYQKEYQKSEKYKKYIKEYNKSDKYKDYKNKYNNQLCYYNGETLTLCALCARFRKAGIEHPQKEAKKYLL